MDTRTSRHKDLDHHSHQSSSSSPMNTVCVLSDHQPANHQEFELSVTEETTVNTGKSKEHCAQGIKSEFKDARTQRISQVVDLNCHAILGMDILGDASKLPFILDLVGGTLSGGGYETIQLHRFQAATECFAETTDSVCIPPHSEVMLWAKLKTNNGRRGPTAGVVLALQTFVQEFGLLVGRSLVENTHLNIQLRSVHKDTSRLHVQPSYSTSAYTHRARGGDPGDPTYRLPGDRDTHRGGRAPTTFD